MQSSISLNKNVKGVSMLLCEVINIFSINNKNILILNLFNIIYSLSLNKLPNISPNVKSSSSL